MKKMLSILAISTGLLTLAPATSFAQTKKPQMTIGVYPLKSSGGELESEQAAQLTGLITQVAKRSGQFKVIAASQEDLTKSIRDKQKEGDYISGSIAKQFQADGALQALSGTLNTCEVKRNEGTNTGKLLVDLASAANTSITMGFSLDLVDVSTNELLSSESFTVAGSGASLGDAQNNAQRRAKRYISNWLVKQLNYEFQIIDVASRTKKNFPETVIINGGQNMDLNKMEKLEVVEITDLNGYKREIPVCHLTVKEVQGEVTICTVNMNDRENLQTKLDAKVPLRIWFRESNN